MNFINFKKTIKQKKGSALLIIVMIFFTIFVLAFGSGYLVFLNIYKTSDVSDNLKAYYAAKAGADRANFEAIKNNYDFTDNCIIGIFTEELSNESTYSINCTYDGQFHFYSIGSYKKSQVALPINCIDITSDCLESCLTGSLCGGGKLFRDSSFEFIVTPSGCNYDANFCDNYFINDDALYFPWNSSSTIYFYGATSTDDGTINVAIVNPQANPENVAIKYCYDLIHNGYSDWYLPAINELSAIRNSSMFSYLNLISTGIYSSYWSSSEFDLIEPNWAQYVYMHDGSIGGVEKGEWKAVRCIRK